MKKVYIVRVYQRVVNIVSSFWTEMTWVRSSECGLWQWHYKTREQCTLVVIVFNHVVVSMDVWVSFKIKNKMMP